MAEESLPGLIALRQPPHLPFPNHRNDFATLDCSPGSVEGPEALLGVDAPFHYAVVRESIRKLEETISEQGSKLEGHKSLTSIKGIGKITGATLLSVIGDVNDFRDERRLASCLRIVRRVSNSNQIERSGRIHKRDSRLGRTALVQSALIAANYSPYLQNLYLSTPPPNSKLDQTSRLVHHRN